jgi:type II restriction enzyme
MNTDLRFTLGDTYRSRSQQARVVTETWAANNIYCLACPSPRIESTPAGTPVVDFFCAHCGAPYQLKSSTQTFGHRVMDGAYKTMLRAVKMSTTPHLLLLHYDRTGCKVADLLLIPKFAVTQSSLEERPPLRPDAARAGWIGCNILLRNIPSDARIPVIHQGTILPPAETRAQFQRALPLSKLKPEQRGWTLDVLNIVRSLGREHFTLKDVYEFESSLAALHPQNQHVQEKIRQQLQVLRDIGFIQFFQPGHYRVAKSSLSLL